jgi:hypothetical protein
MIFIGCLIPLLWREWAFDMPRICHNGQRAFRSQPTVRQHRTIREPLLEHDAHKVGRSRGMSQIILKWRNLRNCEPSPWNYQLSALGCPRVLLCGTQTCTRQTTSPLSEPSESSASSLMESRPNTRARGHHIPAASRTFQLRVRKCLGIVV